ncbi:uncharacterized protein C8orf74 homolog [Diadema antillarum]|uniref:uncharacterized protein C8orf74 homolog n=1 Tax=Diadema antillarum TaxID=105358 RepID=UPI003A8C51B3
MAADISVEDAKTVANLQRADGRSKLGELLGWEMIGFDEDAQMRESILLDFLYESLMYGVQKGFPWSQVCSVLRMAAEFHQGTVGQPLSSAVRIYRELSQKFLSDGQMSESNLRLFTSHLFETYLAHYHLYQVVFTTEREPLTVRQHLVVMQPPVPFPLDEGKPFNTWEYQRRLEEIEGEETSRKETLKSQEEGILKELEGGSLPFSELKEQALLLNREQISQLIEDASRNHANQTEKLLQTRVEERHEDLAFYLEKTALPRPEHLGPPPRTKSPPRMSAKSRASGKVGSDAKGASSARSKKSKKSAKGD